MEYNDTPDIDGSSVAAVRFAGFSTQVTDTWY